MVLETNRALIQTHQQADHVDSTHPRGFCEGYSASALSPGIVQSCEVLLRVLIVPFHADRKKNIVTESALSAAETSGLSLFREDLAGDAEIKSVAEELVNNARASGLAKAGVHGVLRFQCSVFRELRATDEIDACYSVYDTSLPNNVSHSESFQHTFGTDELRRKLRRRDLLKKVKPLGLIPVASFRSGLLNYLAAPARA